MDEMLTESFAILPHNYRIYYNKYQWDVILAVKEIKKVNEFEKTIINSRGSEEAWSY